MSSLDWNGWQSDYPQIFILGVQYHWWMTMRLFRGVGTHSWRMLKGVQSFAYSVHGILQARILEWASISFSRGSSRPRDWTRVSCLAGEFFTTEPPGKLCILITCGLWRIHRHASQPSPCSLLTSSLAQVRLEPRPVFSAINGQEGCGKMVGLRVGNVSSRGIPNGRLPKKSAIRWHGE